MQHICLYFQVHQPFRLKTYRFFDIGRNHQYFDEDQNRSIMKRVAENCYLPANDLLLNLIKKAKGKFTVSFSISGTAIDQFELYAPQVLDSFKELAQTGAVEFLAETSAHSLASVANEKEFCTQLEEHRLRVENLFGMRPRVVRNTELIYSNSIGSVVHNLGFDGILTEGVEHVLDGRSPNHLYHHPINRKLLLILKNYKLSDDIAFRFNAGDERGNQLSVENFLGSLDRVHRTEPIINLFMDYETFGEHHRAENGILNFLNKLCVRIMTSTRYAFITPTEAIGSIPPRASLPITQPISWADEARDLSAWLGNDLQYDAFTSLYELADEVRQSNNKMLLRDWHYLQTSDHFYYMSTKSSCDGEVHQYFSPYESPYSAYINYMNILHDFRLRVQQSSRLMMKESNAMLVN